MTTIETIPSPTSAELTASAFCSAPHPFKAGNACRRIAGHDGDHSAYTDSIAMPETWADFTLVEYDDDDADDAVDYVDDDAWVSV
jgi:hypothetical protein